MTHLAVADEPDDPYTAGQLAVFERRRTSCGGGFDPPYVHAANSAGALAHPGGPVRRRAVRHRHLRHRARPRGGRPARLRPALRWAAEVSYVKRLAAGERVSYGLRHKFTAAANVVTVPVGYADGVPRRLAAVGGEVLIGGRRRPIVGVVTMDQLMVDCGDDPVRPGDEVVLLGAQGSRAGHRPRSGPSASARSATRSSAASGRGCPACTPAASGAS